MGKFDRDPARLIVSDWMMPGMDGLALCEKVRERSQTLYTYFILLTANHTSAQNYELASAAGVDDFLTKPLDREAIRSVCAWRNASFETTPLKSGSSRR